MKDYLTARQILDEAIRERETLKKRSQTCDEEFWKTLLALQREKVQLLKELLVKGY